MLRPKHWQQRVPDKRRKSRELMPKKRLHERWRSPQLGIEPTVPNPNAHSIEFHEKLKMNVSMPSVFCLNEK